ncbi:MAG: gliding motility-associated C-terminal domain-containing protein [Flavobacteriales bacterium]|nr:gliding motility-associated C-terminal domain-containing protein [Flavobacteriales bacterium]
MILLFAHAAFSQQCGVIHVTPGGAGSGAAGTRSNPASLTYGLSLASGGNTVIWMAAGTYPIVNTLQIPSGITLEGGFNPATWVKSNATASVIGRSAANVLPAPANALVGLAALNATGFRLQDLTIDVAAASGAEVSVYGIYLNGCSDYNIVRCVVTTGAGGAGLSGSPGAAGVAGGNGQPGQPGASEPNLPQGGNGGVGAQGNNGGRGQNGGRHAGGTNPGPGLPGQPAGCGGTGGATGTGPENSFFNQTPSCGSVTSGQPGQPGGNGTAGAAGTVGGAGSIAGGYYAVGGPGGDGVQGNPGCGGGGGGGGGGRQLGGSDNYGAGGGGGGAGGSGGGGGIGGTGGGGSFALFLVGNGAGGSVVDCNLSPGPGGVGGTGGAGGAGGAGGGGGAGGTAGACANSFGGAGGTGGTGGPGGVGGSGANGPSAALSENGGTLVAQQNITSVPGNPPVISVENYGCTNSNILFSSAGGGAWTFGAGATPASANGSGPIAVTYSSMGRKTVTLNGTPFTDFVLIFTDGPATPSITPHNGTVDAGCPNSFTTSLQGTQYDWVLPGAQPATASGPTMTTASDIYFAVPGTYTVYVTVQTPCCGPVTDSTMVTVQPSNFDVNLSVSASQICDGDALTVTADGNYLNYAFFVNGTVAQDGASNVFTSSSLQNGDLINVVALVGSCFANPSDTIEAVVNPIPAVTLTSDDPDDQVCHGDLLTFTATPAGYDSYEFFNGNNSMQDGASNILFGSLLPNNSITVVATDNGCSSSPSNAIATVIHPIPVPVLSSSDADDAICEGDAITFTVLPSGLADYEFFEGVASVQSGSGNIYSTSSLQDGTTLTVIATSAQGCVSEPSNAITTVVNPYPAVTLSSSDADNTICEGESITFTASPSGFDSYQFLDGTTPVQNTSDNAWITAGLVSGNSVTVIPTDLGCTGAASNAIVVTIIPSPVVDPGTDFELCEDAVNETLSGFSPTVGTWSGTGITNPTGVFSPTTAGAGIHVLSYAVSDGNCTTTGTIEATVHALPTVASSPSRSICLGETIGLNANGGVSYVWSPATGLSDATVADPVATPVVTTTYTATGTDTYGCVNTSQTTITVDPVPDAQFTGTDVCLGAQTQFTNASTPVGQLTYAWSFGNGASSTEENPSHLYQGDGTYNVQLVAIWDNCTDTVTVPIIVHPRPEADFFARPSMISVIDPLVTFENLSTGDDTWLWSFGDGSFADEENPNHAYQDTGAYRVWLTAVSEFGCRDSVNTDITVTPYTTIYVPSAFTPGTDGVNDLFQAYGEDVTGFDMKVFNRWGQMVYFSTNIEQGWDGGPSGLGGDTCPGGVYTWVIQFVDFRGRTQQIAGKVVLIR